MNILVLNNDNNLRATTAGGDSRRYTTLMQATRGREIISPSMLITLSVVSGLRRRRTCTQSRIADAAAVVAKAEPPPDRIPGRFPFLPIASRGNNIRLVVFNDMIIVTAAAAVFTHPTSIPQALACRCHGCLHGTAVHTRRED